MAITDWPAGERPREKLLQKGAQALSDAELLAIFLRVGVRGMSAVDLARSLLQHFKTLNGIFSASATQINQIRGMGASKYCQLQAVLEMCKRALYEDFSHAEPFRSPSAVADYLKLHIGHLPHEVFMVLLLDTQNRIIHNQVMFEGSLTQTSVYPREVVKYAIAHNTAAVIFAHNHPTGIAQPSRVDQLLTKQLQQSLQLFDIKVLDHFVVAGNQAFSFAEHGLL